MKRIISTQELILAGCVAAALAALFAAAGIAIFGREMLPNLLAELSGVSLEVAIIILIVERITTRQRRRDARFAYNALSNRAAMTFVDVMRLLWVRSSAVAMDFNGRRYDEFCQIAELHLGEFRSNIEGFAGSLDPSSHEILRRIDRRLSWAISRLRGKPESDVGLRELEDLVKETSEIIARFLADDGGNEFEDAKASALSALQESKPETARETETSLDRLFRWRLQAQEGYLQSFGSNRPTPRGILYDADNDLAFGYFSIDREILSSEI